MVQAGLVIDADLAELAVLENRILEGTAATAAAPAFIIQGAQVSAGGAHSEGSPRALILDPLEQGAQAFGQHRALGLRQGRRSAHEPGEGIRVEHRARAR